MKISGATIHTPFHDRDGRKYIEVIYNFEFLKLKIPFRYGRVMIKTDGLKTIHEFCKGDIVDMEVTKKVWDGIEFLVVESIKDADEEWSVDPGDARSKEKSHC